MATKFVGVAKFKRRLAAIPERSKPAIRAAIAKSAEDIVTMMKRLVPVDQGDLRNSIGWRFGDAPKGSRVVGKTQGIDPDLTATIFAGDDLAFYAAMVEFGTVANKAQPYFFPAYHANKKAAKSRIKRAATKAAKETA